jgi:hypothetical protein
MLRRQLLKVRARRDRRDLLVLPVLFWLHTHLLTVRLVTQQAQLQVQEAHQSPHPPSRSPTQQPQHSHHPRTASRLCFPQLPLLLSGSEYPITLSSSRLFFERLESVACVAIVWEWFKLRYPQALFFVGRTILSLYFVGTELPSPGAGWKAEGSGFYNVYTFAFYYCYLRWTIMRVTVYSRTKSHQYFLYQFKIKATFTRLAIVLIQSDYVFSASPVCCMKRNYMKGNNLRRSQILPACSATNHAGERKGSFTEIKKQKARSCSQQMSW